jgi:hypothetical protein
VPATEADLEPLHLGLVRSSRRPDGSSARPKERVSLATQCQGSEVNTAPGRSPRPCPMLPTPPAARTKGQAAFRFSPSRPSTGVSRLDEVVKIFRGSPTVHDGGEMEPLGPIVRKSPRRATPNDRAARRGPRRQETSPRIVVTPRTGTSDPDQRPTPQPNEVRWL